MEGELFNVIKRVGENEPGVAPQFAKQFPDISFIPQENKEGVTDSAPEGLFEKCAIIGVISGGASLVLWAIILFGIFTSIIGIVFSVAGLRSDRKKHARIGLALSVVGFIASVLYLLAIYNGDVNYDYFTSEFWHW